MESIWIEIPVADLDRARRFYEAVFHLDRTEIADQGIRSIVVIEGRPNVSLNRTDGFRPSTEGSVPYFHVDDLDASVAAAADHGGAIVQAATERPGLGRFALVHDSEGNALYLHGVTA